MDAIRELAGLRALALRRARLMGPTPLEVILGQLGGSLVWIARQSGGDETRSPPGAWLDPRREQERRSSGSGCMLALVTAMLVVVWLVVMCLEWPPLTAVLAGSIAALVVHQLVRRRARTRVLHGIDEGLAALGREATTAFGARLAALAPGTRLTRLDLELDVAWLDGVVTRHAGVVVRARDDARAAPLLAVVCPTADDARAALVGEIERALAERFGGDVSSVSGAGSFAIPSRPWRAPRGAGAAPGAEVMVRDGLEWRRGVVLAAPDAAYRSAGAAVDAGEPGSCRVALEVGGAVDVAPGDLALSSDEPLAGAPRFGRGDSVLAVSRGPTWKPGTIADAFGPLRCVDFGGDWTAWLDPGSLQLVATRNWRWARRWVGPLAKVAAGIGLVVFMIFSFQLVGDDSPDLTSIPPAPPPPLLTALPAVGETVIARRSRSFDEDHAEVGRVVELTAPNRVGVAFSGHGERVEWFELGSHELYRDTLTRGSRVDRSDGNLITSGVVLGRRRDRVDFSSGRGAPAEIAVEGLLVSFRDVLRAAPRRPLAPLSTAPEPGAAVLGRPPSLEYCFLAKVASVDRSSGAERFVLAFDDGDRAEVPLADLFEDSLQPGAAVSARFEAGGSSAWYPGVVASRSRASLRVYFDDGDTAEVPRARVRAACPRAAADPIARDAGR